ncbi:MAG: pyridoxal-phosphate dependent enzyme [Rhizomicrobium sp.]
MAIRGLSPEQLRRGVVTASGGNHAIAVAVASRAAGTTARVFMGRQANPFRQQRCRDLGADITWSTMSTKPSLPRALRPRMTASPISILSKGRPIATGTATVGLELMEQVADLDAVIVPVGGGGLLAGIAAAVKQLRPQCAVYGVEPVGADTMYRSFQAGTPQEIAKIDTIADSLGSPTALAIQLRALPEIRRRDRSGDRRPVALGHEASVRGDEARCRAGGGGGHRRGPRSAAPTPARKAGRGDRLRQQYRSGYVRPARQGSACGRRAAATAGSLP